MVAWLHEEAARLRQQAKECDEAAAEHDRKVALRRKDPRP